MDLTGVDRRGDFSSHIHPDVFNTVGIPLIWFVYFNRVHNTTTWTFGEVIEGPALILRVSKWFFCIWNFQRNLRSCHKTWWDLPQKRPWGFHWVYSEVSALLVRMIFSILLRVPCGVLVGINIMNFVPLWKGPQMVWWNLFEIAWNSLGILSLDSCRVVPWKWISIWEFFSFLQRDFLLFLYVLLYFLSKRY